MSSFPRSFLLALALVTSVHADTVFLEAESFKPSADGWRIESGPENKQASGTSVLNGASGAKNDVATHTVTLKDPGSYRVWVRFTSHERFRGAFRLALKAGDREVAGHVFDEAYTKAPRRIPYVWESFDAELPSGELTLTLAKHEGKIASNITRRVDCVLLTNAPNLVPNHLDYGAQTFLRVTFGEGYAKPVYLHVFADHYHAPWYQHYSLAAGGAIASVNPPKGQLLPAGGQTPWCNISPLVYQDSGAALRISVRYSYTEPAERLRAKIELATTPDEKSIVRTFDADCQPNGMVLLLPPNLNTPENLALLKTDRDVAEETGRRADAFAWPTHGKKPERFPFFVSYYAARGNVDVDAAVRAREDKTLAYFGFTPEHPRIHGVWYFDGTYSRPEVAKMKERAAAAAAEFRKAGGSLKDVVFCELTDEPTGQKLELLAKDEASNEAFRTWLKKLGQTPAELLVSDWAAVRIVTEAEREQFPALYYFSQRFRSRALGDFMATQRHILEEAYGGTFPVLNNFSDGAVYNGNFYAQGVDYFELLDSPDQNAIWGEDWSNNASTYQCAAYNTALMRAAAQERGQKIGHHLIAYAGRKPWDVKLKATGELARGVKILNNFAYGPSWASHEGGPYWNSSVWYAKPETWFANASLTREIGAVEDLLVEAMPAPAEVALLYSSATDAWTTNDNAFGHDRMHTWLALTHAQVPVDIVHERQVETGTLDRYKVCYLTGPNLTRAAAEKLKAWVERGGTLFLTAGAASRDEYNRPLTTLEPLVPATRGALVELQKHTGSGRAIRGLSPKGEVHWDGGAAPVVCEKQSLEPRPGAEVLAKFSDGSPALVKAGTVYCAGYLPGLSYIKHALDARFALEEAVKQEKDAGVEIATAAEAAETKLLERSYNPWRFPADQRDFLLMPVHAAKVVPPIKCSVPLVDAVYMAHPQGALIPLSNYTLKPIEHLSLEIHTLRPVTKIDSARRGPLTFQQPEPGRVTLELPLEENDFLALRFE